MALPIGLTNGFEGRLLVGTQLHGSVDWAGPPTTTAPTRKAAEEHHRDATASPRPRRHYRVHIGRAHAAPRTQGTTIATGYAAAMNLYLAAACLLHAFVTAQAPAPIQPQEYRQRREALAEAIAVAHPDEPVLVLLRGRSKPDDMGAFRQDQDFFYLTGIAEPDVAMLLVIGAGKLSRDELLVPPFSPFAARWDGRFLAPGAASAERTGFATVGNVRALPRLLAELQSQRDSAPWRVVTATRPAAVIGSTPSQAAQAAGARRKDPLDGRSSREQAFVTAIERALPGSEVESLEQYVFRMRPQKSAAEIALIRRSTEIAAEGIGEAMRSVRPGVFEYQLAAIARCVFSLNGCGPDAYAAIVGGGPNGCILHYSACTRRLLDDDLIVMDYAATLHGYASDVTRTFPTSGTFTKAQRKLVTDVHEIQAALIAEVKPGARLSQLSRKCARLLQERGYGSAHGPCHHVGLAVHDPSVDELQPGMLLTVEPGAYLDKQGYGCRIEDVVLVTEDGCEVLSAGVPSHPDAIEAWMKQAPRYAIPAAR